MANACDHAKGICCGQPIAGYAHKSDPAPLSASADILIIEGMLTELCRASQALLGHDTVRIRPDIEERANREEAAREAIRARFRLLESENRRLRVERDTAADNFDYLNDTGAEFCRKLEAEIASLESRLAAASVPAPQCPVRYSGDLKCDRAQCLLTEGHDGAHVTHGFLFSSDFKTPDPNAAASASLSTPGCADTQEKAP